MDNRNRFWESGPSAILSKADKWKQKNWGEEDGTYSKSKLITQFVLVACNSFACSKKLRGNSCHSGICENLRAPP